MRMGRFPRGHHAELKNNCSRGGAACLPGSCHELSPCPALRSGPRATKVVPHTACVSWNERGAICRGGMRNWKTVLEPVCNCWRNPTCAAAFALPPVTASATACAAAFACAPPARGCQSQPWINIQPPVMSPHRNSCHPSMGHTAVSCSAMVPVCIDPPTLHYQAPTIHLPPVALAWAAA